MEEYARTGAAMHEDGPARHNCAHAEPSLGISSPISGTPEGRRAVWILLSAFFVAAVLLTGVGAAGAQEAAPPGGPRVGQSVDEPQKLRPSRMPPDDRVIVKFKPSANAAERAEIKREERVGSPRALGLIDAQVLRAEGRGAVAAAKALEQRREVEYASPNRLYVPADYGDEPRFAEQWGLNNTGQVIDHEPQDAVPGVAGVPDVDVDALEASAITRGDSDLVVAVLDDGVDFSHPDLAARAWTNQGEIPGNNDDDDQNGCTDDVHGCSYPYADGAVGEPGTGYHGTHVAGIVAASENGRGIVGVAPNVQVMAVRCLGEAAGGSIDIIDAITYAVANGADIMNGSFVGSDAFADPPLKDAIENSGLLFVAAAGNGGEDFAGDDNDLMDSKTTYPASFDSPNIISVAAATNRGGLPSFSNYGAKSVDIAAPGQYVLSSVPGGGWEYDSGTSMAAPHVTGAAALAASANPQLLANPVTLKQTVLDNAEPLPATAGKTLTGGMVNAKTDATAPTVVGVSPQPGAQKVAAYATVEAQFSEAMSANTLNAQTLSLAKQGGTTPISARVAYAAADKKAVLTPDADLAPSTTYVATLRGGQDGAKDSYGNPIAADKTWSFTTDAPDATPPNTRIVSAPNTFDQSNDASFGFSSSEPRSTFLCRIDWTQGSPPVTDKLPPYERCDSPKLYSALGDGRHLFQVKAVDHAGNVDSTPAETSWAVDTVDPTVSAPAQSFVESSTLGVLTFGYSATTRISWSGTDDHAYHDSGVWRYELQRSIDGGAWSGDLLQQDRIPPLAGGPARSASFPLTVGNSYKFRVRGEDGAGRWSPWSEGSSFPVRGYDDGNAAISYPTGNWTRAAVNGAYNDALRHENDNARARLSFTGRSVAWVASETPNRGKAEVWIDGNKVSTVDLYSPSAQNRRIVFSKSWATSDPHTLSVVLLGTKNADSGSTRVDVDAFLVAE